MHLQISDIQWILKLSLLRRYFQIDFATGDNEKTTGLLNIKRTADYRRFKHFILFQSAVELTYPVVKVY